MFRNYRKFLVALAGFVADPTETALLPHSWQPWIHATNAALVALGVYAVRNVDYPVEK